MPLDALRNMNAPHTTVIRGGKKKNILTKEVVVLVILSI